MDENIFDQKMSRRSFLDWLIRGGLFATLAGMLAPALAYLWPVTHRGPATGMAEIGREDEIPVGGSKKMVTGGTTLLVVRTAKEFRAFSAVCTHLGCIVFWDSQKNQIACPCHAGFFDLDGHVVAGPPPRPLQVYPVQVMDGKVFVRL